MEKLKKDLFYAGRDVGFTGDMVDVINHAVSTHTWPALCWVTCAETPSSSGGVGNLGPYKFYLKGYSELLGFWTLAIVRYFRN
jgi:hypothetical protein